MTISQPVRKMIVVMVMGMALLSMPVLSPAQTASSPATRELLEKAHTLEAKGRIDMASQTWQQVLLTEPNNTEALGGLARAAKLRGDQAATAQYLGRLKAINPNDPNIERVENMMAEQQNLQQLQQAGKLAASGQYAQAMNIYRQVFGNTPRPGDWALAYYETESATEDGRPHAIAGLRSLMDKYPADSRYQIALGRILTYNPTTRAEGRRYLERHPNDPSAVEALRQSLTWDAQNPAAAGDIRAYLSRHKDPGLEAALRSVQAQQAAQRRTSVRTAGPALTPEQQAEIAQTRAMGQEEQAAYNALNAKRLAEAEERFKALLEKDPDNARGLAGMGYIRMQQSNFGGAISFLEQAKQDGARDAGLENALSTSRFWYTMGEGTTALNENDLTTAERQFRAALTMKPSSPEALEGLSGTLMKAQQPGAALPYYEQYVRLRPTGIIGWRGLFTAQFESGNAALALGTERKMPVSVRSQLMRDPDYLRTLASAYSAVGRDADAQRILKGALELPFPADGRGMKVETQLQYASLLLQSNRMDQAAGLFRQVLSEDAANVAAWQGLIRVEHAAKNDALAEQTLESMPPSVYDKALHDPGFASTVASVYQAQNKMDIAQDMLEKSVSQQTMAGQKPSVALQTQLASVYLQRGNSQQAYAIYRQVLQANPDRVDAWKGLLTSLHATGHDQEALAQVQQIPLITRKELEADPDYLQTIGGIYTGLGEPREAMVFMQRVQQYYAARHASPPVDIDIQDAWLLYNSQNDTGLFRQLMMIGGRADLTEEQRRTLQTIWASWAVRRANQAVAANNIKRSLAILNAAARAFPDNPGVIRALASGYARAGQPKQAVAIFKSQDLTAATASDYKAAIGAALAAGDTKDAEIWLRYGLDQSPKDAQLLILGAKFEQARGDSGRAAEYYKASLAAMPPGDPGAELASELSASSSAAGSLPNTEHAQDLVSLLGMSSDMLGVPVVQNEPTPPPYLPSYTNLYGTAPVQITNGQVSPGTYPGTNVVPAYMGSPAGAKTTTPRSGTSRLKDYVPQSSNAAPTNDGRQLASVQPLPAQPESAARAYQQEQIRRLTQQAAESSQLALNTQTESAAYSNTQYAPIKTQHEEYGPYVPYVPGQVPAYQAMATQVQLGGTSTRVMAKQPEVTDVLPGTKYVPNSKTSRLPAVSSHPDIRAVQEAKVRSHQSDPPIQFQVNPPAAIANQDVDIVPVQTAQYTAGGGQITQPQQAPAPSATTQQSGYLYQNQLQTQAQQNRDTSFGQQYPRPERTPATPRRRAITRSRSIELESGPASPPLFYPGVPVNLSGQPYPRTGPAYPLDNPPTDTQLVSRNLPPLRGSYNPNLPLGPGRALSDREQTELDLASLEASYSAWVGGSVLARYRSGRPGFEKLSDLEAPFEMTLVAGKTMRLSVIPRPVFLNSGTLDTTVFQNQTGTAPILGTLPANALNSPSQQLANGVGGEVQFTTTNVGLALGYTPYQFLVTNVIGRARWRPLGGHLLLFGDRDSVKDTQLSYAGLRDPGSATPVFSGNIWGGVISTGGGARFDVGNERAGFYVSGDGASITGHHVLANTKFEGTTGAYWRVKEFPGYGSLNVGASFFGMHYQYNERGMTYGLGGYFSPEAYFLAGVPITFNGYYKTSWHYVIAGAVGVQSFQEDNEIFFPLDPATQTGAFAGCTLPSIAAHTCGQSPINTNTGLNYSINTEFSYRVADHWYVGGTFTGNNTNNYNTVTAGFFFRYLFKPQYPTESYPTGLFPTDGLRPLRVP